MDIKELIYLHSVMLFVKEIQRTKDRELGRDYCTRLKCTVERELWTEHTVQRLGFGGGNAESERCRDRLGQLRREHSCVVPTIPNTNCTNNDQKNKDKIT